MDEKCTVDLVLAFIDFLFLIIESGVVNLVFSHIKCKKKCQHSFAPSCTKACPISSAAEAHQTHRSLVFPLANCTVAVSINSLTNL